MILLDCRAFGGQAGASSRIENYLGFPTGISGDGADGRAYNQAQKFGVEMAIPDQANLLCKRVEQNARRYVLNIGDDEKVQARAVVVASGARYRRLDVTNLTLFEGSSVHYWASPIEARLCRGQEVALVGAGNSAGQAAVYLASHTKKVWLLARGESLEASMSRYLVQRIKAQPNIEVLTETEITALEGREGISKASAGATGAAKKRLTRYATCFCSSVPIRTRTGLRSATWHWTGKALYHGKRLRRGTPSAGDEPHRCVRHW